MKNPIKRYFFWISRNNDLMTPLFFFGFLVGLLLEFVSLFSDFLFLFYFSIFQIVFCIIHLSGMRRYAHNDGGRTLFIKVSQQDKVIESGFAVWGHNFLKFDLGTKTGELVFDEIFTLRNGPWLVDIPTDIEVKFSPLEFDVQEIYDQVIIRAQKMELKDFIFLLLEKKIKEREQELKELTVKCFGPETYPATHLVEISDLLSIREPILKGVTDIDVSCTQIIFSFSR